MLPVAKITTDLPYNARTGNEYSGANIPTLLGAMDEKGFEDLRWAGFNQWLEVGRVVRKGQKSTGIMFVGDVQEKDATGAVKTRENGEARTSKFVRTVPVFNFEQTDEISAEDARAILDAKAARREAKATEPKGGKRASAKRNAKRVK